MNLNSIRGKFAGKIFPVTICIMGSSNFTLHFSGHETFALRYGWLNKSYNLLNTKEKNEEKLIVSLGVGKNMVNSIKYWTDISGLIPMNSDEIEKNKYTSQIADIFEYYDEYLEMNVSTWLLHYFIQKNFNDLTFFRWYFNFCNKQYFEKDELINDLINWLEAEGLKVPSLSTLQKDFDCFILCYTRKKVYSASNEEAFISPLNELGLVHLAGGNKFKSDLFEQKSLNPSVFLYCLVSFWKENFADSPTISVDSVLSNPGSPGRIFRINSIGIDYFLNQCALIDKRFEWTDTLGIRSLSCNNINEICLNKLLENIYSEIK